MNEGDFLPYNGTVFSLTGVLQLDTNIVDTDITVMWVWSLNSRELDTQTTSASPHEIIISFNPLATNSSGRYSLNLTIMPNNLQYVEGNSDSSTTYNLNVLSEFWIFNSLLYSLNEDFPFIGTIRSRGANSEVVHK